MGLIAGTVVYLNSGQKDEPPAKYETFALIRGERSSGMPLAGISVDPSRRDVYAVIGRPSGKTQPLDFFILWKSPSGKSYAATFAQDEAGGVRLFEIDPAGDVTLLQGEGPADPRRQETQVAKLDAQLRPILDALPAEVRPPL